MNKKCLRKIKKKMLKAIKIFWHVIFKVLALKELYDWIRDLIAAL